MVVRDNQIDSREATAFEPVEEALPTALGLAVAHLQSQDLAVAQLVDACRQQRTQRTHRPHPSTFTHLEYQGIDQHKRVPLPAQVALVPRLHERVEALAQVGDGRFGKAGPTQLLGNPGHLPRRDAVDDTLHEREHQGLFAALVAREQLGRELPVTHLRHLQRECAYPRRQRTGLVAVAIPLPLLAALIGRRLELLGDLGTQHLVQDGFQQPAQLAFAGKQALHSLA